jgi:hypothetical protein
LLRQGTLSFSLQLEARGNYLNGLGFLGIWASLYGKPFEHVPDTRRADDEPRFARHWLDLFAQMANMRLHQISIPGLTKSPDVRHNLIQRADIVGISGEQMQ